MCTCFKTSGVQTASDLRSDALGLMIISSLPLLITYKIVVACVLGFEILQNNMHVDGRSKTSEEARILLLVRVAITRINHRRFC